MNWHPIDTEFSNLDKKVMSGPGLIRPHLGSIKRLYRMLDLLIILCCFIASVYYNQTILSIKLQVIVLFSLAIYLFVAEYCDVYRSFRTSEPSAIYYATWTACGITALVIFSIIYFISENTATNYDIYIFWFTTSIFSLTIFRLSTLGVLGAIRMFGYNSRKAAIVGATAVGEKLENNLKLSAQTGIQTIGFFDDRDPMRVTPKNRQKLCGTIDDLIELAKNGAVDIIYIALPMRAQLRISDILKKCSNSTVSVHIIPDFFVYNILHARFYSIGSSQTLSIFETPVDGVGVGLKRIEDFVLASIILFILVVPMLLIAAGIKLTSRGPILFKQYRYGLCGRKIEVWKFRTMHVSNEDEHNISQATKGDVRVTPFGHFLRTTSLDELPQFFNVLQGSMSVVGPRPHAICHNEQYRILIDGYMLRHKVKPGITGWAQINGFRGETETLDKMEKRVEYDLAYIRNWSLRFDVEIVFLTLFTAFSDSKAY